MKISIFYLYLVLLAEVVSLVAGTSAAQLFSIWHGANSSGELRKKPDTEGRHKSAGPCSPMSGQRFWSRECPKGERRLGCKLSK